MGYEEQQLNEWYSTSPQENKKKSNALDKVDINKTLEYVKSTVGKFAHTPYTRPTIEQFKATLTRLMDDCNMANTKIGNEPIFNINSVTIEPSSKECNVALNINPYALEGWSALDIRELGCKIDASIPDCATLKNGIFEWLQAEYEIKPTKGI